MASLTTILLFLIHLAACVLLLYIGFLSISAFLILNNMRLYFTYFVFSFLIFLLLPLYFFLLSFLYFLLPYFLKILVVTLSHAHLLVLVLATFFDHFCYFIPAFLRFFLKVWYLIYHFQCLVYKYITNCLATPHYQHSMVFITLIKLKNVPITPYLILS